MAQVQEIQLQIGGIQDTVGVAIPQSATPRPKRRDLRWWVLVVVDMVMLLGGQATTILLGRLYFNSGGNSAWMFTLAHSISSPLLLIPLLLAPPAAAGEPSPPATSKMAVIYVALGLLIAFDNLMYSYAILFLPVSTFSLLSATQLAFNAVSSRLINAQRFTAPIANSVVVLTFAGALLGVGSSSDDTTSAVPRGKYGLGFALTLAAGAVYALILSLIEATFERVVRARTLRWALRMQVYTNAAAAATAVAALTALGEWRAVRGEMAGFRGGRAAYMATFAGIAVSWQAATLGMVRLITRASSLFANVTSTLGLPLVPILAVVMFGDKVTGIKVVAMLMAVWGFLSFVYQHYLDDDSRAGENDDGQL
ncbi:hypothetical protein ACP4OV_021970 [Aristida adscensionis]